VVPGTTGAATIAYGGYRLIYIEIRPDQECVMVVRGEPATGGHNPGSNHPGDDDDIHHTGGNI
jgi:hypothetical protein